jgi:hypothetical protein
MSSKESVKPEPQFTQEIPEARQKVRLDERYKSIGISAVSAALGVKAMKSKKTPDQMS